MVLGKIKNRNYIIQKNKLMKFSNIFKLASLFLLLLSFQIEAQNTIGYALGHPNGTSAFGFGTYSTSWKFASSGSAYPTTPFIATGTYGTTTINFYLNGSLFLERYYILY